MGQQPQARTQPNSVVRFCQHVITFTLWSCVLILLVSLALGNWAEAFAGLMPIHMIRKIRKALGEAIDNNVESFMPRFRPRLPKANRRPPLPRILALFSFILPPEFRERVFEPARQHLENDIKIASKSYRTKWSRRWLAFAFGVRAAFLFVDCIRLAYIEKILEWIPWIRPR